MDDDEMMARPNGADPAGAKPERPGRSTGPRTARGKAASAMNAVRHGLSAERVVLPGESAEEFSAFRRALLAALAPADGIEAEMADRIVASAWRLRRVPVAEQRFSTHVPSRPGVGAALEHWATQMATLTRHEATLERCLRCAYAALDRHRDREAAKKTPVQNEPLQVPDLPR